jgi:hypothetical protein
MNRIGRADEGDSDCWFCKAEGQCGLHRRPARLEVAGEDLSGDYDRAAFGAAL